MFKDRREAGQKLADALKSYKNESPLLLALPRGGVEVGYYVAQELGYDFSILVCRKLGYPEQPEAAFGAIAEDQVIYLNPNHLRFLSNDLIRHVKEYESNEIKRRVEVYRKGEQIPELAGRTIILVDDGIATGATIMAAVEYCKRHQAEKIVIAAPVSGKYQKQVLSKVADELVILETPENFRAVSQGYQNFSEVTDRDVIRYLELYNQAPKKIGQN